MSQVLPPCCRHRRRLYRYQLQAFASLFDLINVVAQALLLKGIAQNPSYGQVG